MKRKLSILLLVCLLSLAGCSKNEQTKSEDNIENQQQTIIDKKYQESDIQSSNIGYGNDSISVTEYKPYNSGVYADNSTLAEPYIYINPSTIEDEDTDEVTTDAVAINTRLANIDNSIKQYEALLTRYVDGDGQLIVVQNNYETLVETEARIYHEVEDARLALEDLKLERDRLSNLLESYTKNDSATYIVDETSDNDAITPKTKVVEENITIDQYKDILSKYVDNIYDRGLLLLNGATNEDDFNSKNSRSMKGTIDNVRRDLEALEFYTEIISTDLADYEKLNSSWNNLSKYLNIWRERLSKIETGNDFIKARLTVSNEEIEATSNFLIALTEI